MLFYIVLTIIGIIFIIFVTLMLINGNKLKVMDLKIKEAEKEASEIIKKRYEIINNINNIMKDKGKENFFADIDKIEADKIDMFELNNELTKYDKSLIELVEYNKEIVFDDEEQEVFDLLDDNNTNRLAIEKYYNDNVTNYNKSIKRFPNQIISATKKYKEKKKFETEKEEIFEILKK